LQGKSNALVQGIENSAGEIIMFTDADCRVPPSWVENTVEYYTGERVAIVAGFISIRTRNWFEGIQAIDWLVLLSAAAATARLKFAVTAVGNNFSIRRSAYEQVGGYRNIPFSVTEDFALFRAVTTRAGLRAVISLDPETAIESNACRTWKELYMQRKRWFIGGRDMHPTRILAFACIYLLNLSTAVGFLMFDLQLWITLLLAKAATDYLLILPSMRRLGRTDLTKYWLPFQVYYIAYVLLLPLVVLFKPRVVWKERTFGLRGFSS